MAKKQRNYSVKDISEWKFKRVDMPQEWVDHLGNITENFRMLITGPSGHGKTEYAMQLSKMLANFYGKVSFNSTEQGKSASLQESYIRNQFEGEIPPGKWMLCDPSQRIFDEWFKRLQRPNSGRVVILDSLDYMHLTVDQFKQLHERFRHKSIVIIAWSDPTDVHTRKIKYLCDIKVEVSDYVAKIRSRFGGNKKWYVWKDRSRKSQLTLTNASEVN